MTIHMKRAFVSTLALSALLIACAVAGAAAPIPAAGTAAPAFTLPSQEGHQVNLKDYRGKWVVLYFYPKDFTNGCTIEARNFQRDLDQYTGKNAVILGVSVDSVDSHEQFCTKETLTFKLLSDTKADVVSMYGSAVQRGDATMAARTTFLIDPSGVIRKVYEKVNPNPHSEEVLADIAALQKK
jgi:thioredoxin-dependent peroxiredoxin